MTRQREQIWVLRQAADGAPIYDHQNRSEHGMAPFPALTPVTRNISPFLGYVSVQGPFDLGTPCPKRLLYPQFVPGVSPRRNERLDWSRSFFSEPVHFTMWFQLKKDAFQSISVCLCGFAMNEWISALKYVYGAKTTLPTRGFIAIVIVAAGHNTCQIVRRFW